MPCSDKMFYQDLTVLEKFVIMNEITDKAKGAALAIGLLMLLAWPFVGLAVSVHFSG